MDDADDGRMVGGREGKRDGEMAVPRIRFRFPLLRLCGQRAVRTCRVLMVEFGVIFHKGSFIEKTVSH